MRLWKLLDQLQGFQVPKYDDTALKNYIFECKDLMYSAYLEQRSELPENQLAEVKFWHQYMDEFGYQNSIT